MPNSIRRERELRHALVLVLAIALSLASCGKAVDRYPAANRTAENQQLAASERTPESTVKKFFAAMMDGDRVAGEAVIVPDPNSAILWASELISGELRAAMKKAVDELTLRELAIGDTVALPGGRELVVTAERVNAQNKLVVPTLGGMPTPTPLPLRKIDGQWRVDAGSLIAARKAASEIRNRSKRETIGIRFPLPRKAWRSNSV